jgi:dTDP-4-amino-4,6-dideoxygalactose transaminase
MMTQLALFGGEPVRKVPFPKHPIITSDEKTAVLEVLDSGNLSTFIASSGEFFLGGKKIKEFEKKFAQKIGTKFAVAFNSATSALHAAVVAINVKPGEEVIVPPYTFTSTATSVLMHNAIPVFADVKNDTFCIDPNSIKKNITKLTKGITAVHLFGHPCDMDEIMSIAKRNKLKVIEDCAQAPGAKYKGKNIGTIGDCGIFSFQETKNIMTGEGGMLVTDDEEIAKVAQMIRNHGEVTSESQKKRSYVSEILGWGYRMTELEAALGIVQLSKLDKYNDERIKLADFLTENLKSIDGLTHTKYDFVDHVYYVYGLSYDEKIIGIPRNEFCKALLAEGIPFSEGYVKPLYLNPLYLQRRSFAFKHYDGNVKYEKGICPNAENLFENKMILTVVCRPPATIDDMKDVVSAIHKIIENKNEFTINN